MFFSDKSNLRLQFKFTNSGCCRVELKIFTTFVAARCWNLDYDYWNQNSRWGVCRDSDVF